jgi:hypothetical protein
MPWKPGHSTPRRPSAIDPEASLRFGTSRLTNWLLVRMLFGEPNESHFEFLRPSG